MIVTEKRHLSALGKQLIEGLDNGSLELIEVLALICAHLDRQGKKYPFFKTVHVNKKDYTYTIRKTDEQSS